MVRNPRDSQRVMAWCVDSILTLIYRGYQSAIGREDLENRIYEHAKKLGVSKKKAYRMIYDLKRREYIAISTNDSVVLTNKAKIKVIDAIVNNNRKDGKYRLISFDIPEIMRVERNHFRRTIKRMGFRQVQQSLWVSDKNIGDLVDAAAKEYKVSSYVSYFIADASNIDRHIARVLKAS